MNMLNAMKIAESARVNEQKWDYILPDGSRETNMKDAKIKLGVSKTRMVGMIKSGVVKRIEVINSKPLTGYEDKIGIIK